MHPFLAKSGPKLSTFGKKWTKIVHFWQKVDKKGPLLAKSGPKMSTFGRKWTSNVHLLSTFGKEIHKNCPLLAKKPSCLFFTTRLLSSLATSKVHKNM